MIEYFIEGNLGLIESCLIGSRETLYFCFAKSKCIPLRIASALVILCLMQYSFKHFVVLSSSRTFTSLLLGLSTFGLPVRGDTFLTSLYEFHKFIIILGTHKVKRNFN